MTQLKRNCLKKRIYIRFSWFNSRYKSNMTKISVTSWLLLWSKKKKQSEFYKFINIWLVEKRLVEKKLKSL